MAQTEPVGSVRGADVDGYNLVQSWEFGYRFADVGGNRAKYRSDENYRNGFSVLGSSFTANSRDGHGRLFDTFVLTSQGLGNDPYQSATLRIEKNRLYRYDLLWRQNDYYNPGLVVSGGPHLEDTTHRWQDHDLTLFPQSWFRVRAGYSRVRQDGAALTTEQEFTSRDPVYPLFRNLRQQFDDYRVGFDIQRKAWHFTMQRQWEFFKEDIQDDTASAIAFHRGQPYRGRAPSWMGNLWAGRSWIAVNAHATYTAGRGDFVQAETASGPSTFGQMQQQILVAGDAQRPVFSGDFNFTLFPSSRFSLINNTSGANVRMSGANNFTQYDLGTLSFVSLNFQELGIRLITNATDVRWRFSKTLDAFAGFRYSDRLIHSVEDQTSPGTPFSGIAADQTNLTRAGIAGVNWIPVRNLRTHLEAELGRNDNPFTPVSLRDYHAIRAKAVYRTRRNSAGVSYQESNNQNSISVTSFSSRSRSFAADTSWTARSWVSIEGAYSKLHFDSIGGIVYFAGSPRPLQITGQSSIYTSNIHTVNLGMRFTLTKRADLYTGYTLTKDVGDGRALTTADPFYNAQAFPLTFHTPNARLSVRLHEKLRFNVGYAYYGYREKFGEIQVNENYRAHTGYTSLLWAF